MKNNLRVLSLGAGVQSSALALMIEKGEVPIVDCAIFADVKGEPKAVYEWLEYLKTQITKFPIYTVTWRDLKQDILDASEGKHKAFTAPFFSKNIVTGKKRMLRRQCTNMYKISPVVQKVRELIGLEKGEKRKKGTKVEMLMGISKDEIVRMRTNPIKYIKNVYPLVEKEMRRSDCLNWMKDNGYSKPPRSACTFCPFHSNEEWKRVKSNKEEWDKVVALEKSFIENRELITKITGMKDTMYLNRKCVPIDEIDFDENKNKDQLDMFNNECEGVCGV